MVTLINLVCYIFILSYIKFDFSNWFIDLSLVVMFVTTTSLTNHFLNLLASIPKFIINYYQNKQKEKIDIQIRNENKRIQLENQKENFDTLISYLKLNQEFEQSIKKAIKNNKGRDMLFSSQPVHNFVVLAKDLGCIKRYECFDNFYSVVYNKDFLTYYTQTV